MKLKNKLYRNTLLLEQLTKVSIKEKHKIITELLKNKSEGELSIEMGIPKSTIHDWKTLRQKNTGGGLHVSLSIIVRKLENLKPEEITDWGRIEQIREISENLLRKNGINKKR